MSNSEKILGWKRKAEIDYFPLFMALWLSFEAWLESYDSSEINQREKIEKLKRSNLNSAIYKKLRQFLRDTANQNAMSMQFKSNLRNLEGALNRAEILYPDKYQGKGSGKKILSFKNALINTKSKSYENLIMNPHDFSEALANDEYDISNEEEELLEEQDEEGIKISENFILVNDIDKIYTAYVEIAYQFRCQLFHGDLNPSSEPQTDVAKFLYLTLHDLMEGI